MDGGFKITAEDCENHPVTKWPGQWSQVSRCQISQLKMSELHISLIVFQGWQSMCTVRCCQMSEVYNFGIVDNASSANQDPLGDGHWVGKRFHWPTDQPLEGSQLGPLWWSWQQYYESRVRATGGGAFERVWGLVTLYNNYTLMSHHGKWPTKPHDAMPFNSYLAFCLLSCCCLEECISFRLPHEGRIWTVVPSLNTDVPNQWFLRDLSWRFGFSVCIWAWACLIQLILYFTIKIAICVHIPVHLSKRLTQSCQLGPVLSSPKISSLRLALQPGNGEICFVSSGLFFQECVREVGPYIHVGAKQSVSFISVIPALYRTSLPEYRLDELPSRRRNL